MMHSQKIERLIARRTIKELLAAGYKISVNNGEETELRNSTNRKAIFNAMFSTDEDMLQVFNNDSEKTPSLAGWIYFVYGNEGPTVINDYSTNLEPIMEKVNALCDKIEAGEYRIVVNY